MITLTALAEEIQENAPSFVRYCRVESWLDDELLAADIPVSSAREVADRSGRIPERVTLTVPRRTGVADWAPRGEKHPLAALGQRLRVMLGIGLAGQAVEWIQRGEFLIQSAQPRGDSIAVEAVGLLALIDEARLVAPYQPSGTLVSTLRGLVEPALTVVFDSGLIDRSVPAGINYDEDRLGAVQELLAAWPAEAQVSNDGYLVVQPIVEPVQGVLITSQTTISLDGESDRDGAYNCVVARGTASDGGQVQGVAYLYGSGPYRFGGPFNRLPVPQFFASPLLTTVSACKAAATARLVKIQRERSASYTVTAPPLIHLQAGDKVTIGAEGQEGIIGTVEQITLPYLAGDGPMSLTVVEL